MVTEAYDSPTQLREKSQDERSPPNPWLDARRRWNSREAAFTSTTRAAWIVAFMALSVALAVVGAWYNHWQKSAYVPYIVELDRIGQVRAAGPLSASAATDARVVRSMVGEFVRRARMVTPDEALQSDAIRYVGAYLPEGAPARQKVDDWYRNEETNPYSRARTKSVEVEMKSILQQSPETWQVDWSEVERDRQGQVLDRIPMRALVTVYQREASSGVDEAEMQRNPIGLHVREFSWARVL